MRSHLLVSLFAAVGLVGACASQPESGITSDPSGGNPTPEEQYFNEHVKPVMESNCASCHAKADDPTAAPDFLGTSGPDGFYKTITQWGDFLRCDVENSLLLNKGFEANHPGVPIPIEDAPFVEGWLELEALAQFGRVCQPEPADPGGQGGSGQGGSGQGGSGTAGGDVGPTNWPPATPSAHMQAFGDCSTYQIWVETGMPLVANQQANSQGNNTECYNCHNNKNTGLNHMPDPNDTAAVMEAFQNMRYMYRSLNLVRWTLDEQAKFQDVVKSYRWRDATNVPDHPTYELSAEYVASYEAWFDAVYAKYSAAVGTADVPGTGPCNPADGNP